MFRKLVVCAAFLGVATAVNAEEGMKIGVRLGYSMQSVAYNMGMLGLRAGVVADIPIGPIFISPEVDFLYRNNWNTTYIDNTAQKSVDGTQPEFATSIPIMIKFLLGPRSFIAIGAQVDIPIAAKECFGNNCVSMNGKELSYSERADFDVGIILNSGYIITPNLAFDIRYVYGTTPHHKYKESGISGIKSNPMSSYGFGITYFFF